MTVTMSKDSSLTSKKHQMGNSANGESKAQQYNGSPNVILNGTVKNGGTKCLEEVQKFDPRNVTNDTTGFNSVSLNGDRSQETDVNLITNYFSEHDGTNTDQNSELSELTTGKTKSEFSVKNKSEAFVDSLRKIKTSINQKVGNQITNLVDATQSGVAAIQNVKASKFGATYSKLAADALSKLKESPGGSTPGRERRVSISAEATEDAFTPNGNEGVTSLENVQPAKEEHAAGACGKKKEPSSRYVYITGVIHCLCFTFCDTAAKTLSQLLNGTVPSMQMNIGQFTFLIAIMTPYMIITKKMIPQSRVGFLIAVLIGVLKCLNYFCCNLAVLYMPVGTATTEMSAVFLLTILAWTACCSRQFTRTSLAIDICAVFLIICGVVLVVQPPFMFPNVTAPNVTLITVCSKEPATQGQPCYVTANIEPDFPEPLGLEETESISIDGPEDDRPVWKGHLFIIAFGVSSTACLVLLTKGAKYLGNAEIIYWSAITADILSIISFAIYTKCDIYVPQKPLCLFIWILHAICGGATGIFGNTAVIRLPPADFGVISSLSIFNLFILQFTLLQHIKPGHLNAGSVTGAIIICVTTFGKPILRSFTPALEKNDDDESETSKLLVETRPEKEAVNKFCMWCA